MHRRILIQFDTLNRANLILVTYSHTISTEAMSFILGALIFVFSCYLAHTLWTWQRLAHVPGPFWPAFSKLWLANLAFRGKQPFALKRVSDVYGNSITYDEEDLS